MLFQLIINVFIQVRNNFKLSINKNYMFYSKVSFNLNSKNNVFIYIVDVNILIIQIRNIIYKATIIFRYIKLKHVINFKKKMLFNFVRKRLFNCKVKKANV